MCERGGDRDGLGVDDGDEGGWAGYTGGVRAGGVLLLERREGEARSLFSGGAWLRGSRFLRGRGVRD